MADWSLEQLLASLHDDIQQKVSIVRRTIHHPGSKGDASEEVWLELLQTYLPKRYEAAKAHVVDSKGQFSEFPLISFRCGAARASSSTEPTTTPFTGPSAM